MLKKKLGEEKKQKQAIRCRCLRLVAYSHILFSTSLWNKKNQSEEMDDCLELQKTEEEKEEKKISC